MKKTIFFIICFTFLSTLSAQSVNIVLKNSKVVEGDVVIESPEFITIKNDIGELKIDRQLIASITYTTLDNNFDDLKKLNKKQPPSGSDNYSQTNVELNDLVLVFLKNEDVVSGRLVAKSLEAIIVQTEAGSLTIPKREIIKIEYLSSEFSEKGEVVIANLLNETKFEGKIYFEDSRSLILDTEIGRLTIDKKNLRSLVYVEGPLKEKESSYSKYKTTQAVSTPRTYATSNRLDMISFGYSPSFGAEYGTGFGINYTSKHIVSKMEGFYISVNGGLNLNYFLLNKDNFNDEIPTVSASGGNFISTINLGASFTLLQQESSNYEFYIAPQLEGHIIYKTLEISYPSFPAFDSKTSKTKFNFGIGNKIGLDILFDEMKLGVSYDSHFIFGDEDYHTISLNFTTRLF